MQEHDYARVERAIRYVQEQQQQQPDLAAVAAHVGLSPYHFERLFQRWAGTTPKRFLQHLTLDRAKAALAAGQPVFDASLEAGLSGGGRLHDLFVTLDAVTPGEFKRAGSGLEIRTGVHDTPFGPAFFGVTPRGLCALHFVDDGGVEAAGWLAAAWPEATIVEDHAATAPMAEQLAERLAGRSGRAIPVLLRGTNFQLKVWEALLAIPSGETVAYDDVAARLGRPEAVRAVAGAIGRNSVAWVIPCHRVLRKNGALSGYRWGPVRKAALLAWESVHTETPTLQAA